ncbi:DUF6461 domain-containing protein [Streptomyces sp. NPDC017890]|uniref:DUF6461 domain-containing protein n=1 Tax=Streptomyces sp. NPDC017890 TaxID=3365015 RepID=UPI0037A0F9E4
MSLEPSAGQASSLGELKALRVAAGPAVTGLSALREWTIEYCRVGSHPDDLLHVMRKVGFGPMEDPDADEDEDEVKSLTPAKFALAHHVTGVRLTRRLLETAEFTCGLVTKRPATSWLRA